MPRYVVPDTVEQALELLENGLLYRNISCSAPREAKWALPSNPIGLRSCIPAAFARTGEPTSIWHYTDFAYLLED